MKNDKTDAHKTLMKAENPFGKKKLIHTVVWEIISAFPVRVPQYAPHHAYVNS